MSEFHTFFKETSGKRSAVLAALFFLLSLVLFSRSYTSYFVSDDYDFLGRIKLGTASQYFSHTLGVNNEYRPLVAYSYALDGALSGMSPIAYHLTSTILHTATALLIGMILVGCGLPLAFAAIASVIFLINPVMHQSVLWMAGRPLVLSTFFMTLALWAFVSAAMRQSTSTPLWALSHAAFVAALLSYEGAIVFPLFALLLYLFALNRRHRATIRNLIAYGALTLVYLVAWNFFFRFKITRFPVETSILGGLSSLMASVLHIFHGSQRVVPALIYLCLLGILCTRSAGRKLALFGAAWAIVAYLPFLLVRGYADRFAYVSSMAAAVVLSGCIWAVYERSRYAGFGVLLMILCFYGIGMQNRITMWKEAGTIAETIPRDIKAARPELPDGATLVLLNVPDMHKHALVFITGLERAVRLQYPPGAAFSISRELRARSAGAVIIFQYSDGRMRELPSVPTQAPQS